jgi:hypothetical protein
MSPNKILVNAILPLRKTRVSRLTRIGRQKLNLYKENKENEKANLQSKEFFKGDFDTR